MKYLQRTTTVRNLVRMLIGVATIGLSALATYTPTQNQSSLTLKSIRTVKTTTFYADQRSRGAWFVEMVLPTGEYADNRAARGSWFVEMVLPTDNGNLDTENLKSVAAAL